MYKIIASSVSCPADGMFLGSAILASEDNRLFEAHHVAGRSAGDENRLIRRTPT